MTKSEAIFLKNHIDYSSNSIVSKVVLKAKTGHITLFAFDLGQKIDEHSAPFDAFVQIIEGGANIVLQGQSHKLTEGQFIIMPANVPHAVQATSKMKMMLVMIRN